MTKTVERRLLDVERRLADLEAKPAAIPRVPPWIKHGGWAAGDAIHAEALQLGAEWRKRQNRICRKHAGGR